MRRTDYLSARLKQLRAGKLFGPGFSNWLARLELGEKPSASHQISMRRIVDLISALVLELRQRRVI